MGGDEFALLLKNVDVKSAEGIARRVLERVAVIGHDFPGTGFGASAGLAATTGSSSAEDLLRAADDEGKRQGQGALVIRSVDGEARDGAVGG
jgi:GGDEF domain-containing protein